MEFRDTSTYLMTEDINHKAIMYDERIKCVVQTDTHIKEGSMSPYDLCIQSKSYTVLKEVPHYYFVTQTDICFVRKDDPKFIWFSYPYKIVQADVCTTCCGSKNHYRHWADPCYKCSRDTAEVLTISLGTNRIYAIGVDKEN